MDDSGVIIGLAEGGSPVAGGMYLPALDLMYLAERGGGAWRNGTPIHVSETENLQDAVFDHSLANLPGIAAAQARTLNVLINRARAVRCACTA